MLNIAQHNGVDTQGKKGDWFSVASIATAVPADLHEPYQHPITKQPVSNTQSRAVEVDQPNQNGFQYPFVIG
jgi:hypothetical protein